MYAESVKFRGVMAHMACMGMHNWHMTESVKFRGVVEVRVKVRVTGQKASHNPVRESYKEASHFLRVGLGLGLGRLGNGCVEVSHSLGIRIWARVRGEIGPHSCLTCG